MTDIKEGMEVYHHVLLAEEVVSNDPIQSEIRYPEIFVIKKVNGTHAKAIRVNDGTEVDICLNDVTPVAQEGERIEILLDTYNHQVPVGEALTVVQSKFSTVLAEDAEGNESYIPHRDYRIVEFQEGECTVSHGTL